MAPAAPKWRCPQAMLSQNKDFQLLDKKPKFLFSAENDFISSSNNNFALKAPKLGNTESRFLLSSPPQGLS